MNKNNSTSKPHLTATAKLLGKALLPYTLKQHHIIEGVGINGGLEMF